MVGTFGDFWVGTTVPWPWAAPADGAAVSASAALGLGVLQAMRARPPGPATAASASSIITYAGRTLRRRGVAGSEHETPVAGLRNKLRGQATELVEAWQANASGPSAVDKVLKVTRRRAPALVRHRPGSAGKAGETDLLTLLKSAAAKVDPPLDVTVTGHSKGAALVQAVALWLRDALDAPAERWDAGRGATVACYGFAGPTPGNAAFARRFEATLGATHHHLRNRHDIVTHAWQVDELADVPKLYGDRTAAFRPIVDAVVAGVTPLDYRQVRPGVTEFAGPLRPESRGFAAEFIHQHLDAYLEYLGLDAVGIDALTLFLG